MTPVAGRLHKKPARDEHGLYRAACIELADELGWRREEVWATWGEFALLVEFESKWPRALAEYAALVGTRIALDKRGCGEPS